MIWSKYQSNIFDAYDNTRKNLAVEATAGSSKSTVLVECCKRTPPGKKFLFMAFNKSISEELKLKVPQSVEVGTFHSKGLKVLLYNFKFRMKLVENKGFKIALQNLVLDDLPAKIHMRYLFEIQAIWDFCRTNLLVGNDYDIQWVCLEKEIEYRDRMVDDIYIISREWERRASRISESKDFEMDFTDMLYLPYILLEEKDFPKYDVVAIDEAQDINTLQRELILRYVKPRFGRLLSVGDFSQTIYSFQGASRSNFKSLQQMDNTLVLPLSISYRCAKAIVDEANKVFPGSIEASPSAEQGLIKVGDLKEAKEGDFVLCRNNFPLVEAFIFFLEQHKKATIKGKDFGDALCALIERIEEIEDLQRIKDQKLDDLMQKGISKSMAMNNAAYIALEEKCAIINRLYCVWSNMKVLKEQIERIFTEETEGIILSTIHKSKGLEADRVFFLNQNLIPSAYAKTEDALYSENCLKFVAITRAKKELIYCTI